MGTGAGDDETRTFITQTYQRAEAFLFGRRTYELFAGSWGSMDQLRAHPIGVALNEAPIDTSYWPVPPGGPRWGAAESPGCAEWSPLTRAIAPTRELMFAAQEGEAPVAYAVWIDVVDPDPGRSDEVTLAQRPELIMELIEAGWDGPADPSHN